MALVEEVEGLPKVDVNIPLSELDFEKKISKGGFGEVWKASYFGTDVAVKKILRPSDPFFMRLIQREISALKEVRHPNICLFLGVCLDETQIHLVTEFIDGGTLWKLLKNRSKNVPWMTRLNVAVELAKAMTYLHAKGIAHRDLKSDNVLLDKNMNPKICDFGLARGDMNDTATKFLTKAGTDTWMAPEIILGDPYSLKADVFSFGVVLYELIVRDRPPDRVPMDAYQFELDVFVKQFPSDTPPELAALAVSCVAAVPEDRPAFKDLLVTLKDLLIKLKEEAKAARPPKVIPKLPPPLEVPVDAVAISPIPSPIGLTANLMPPPPPLAAASNPKLAIPLSPAHPTAPLPAPTVSTIPDAITSTPLSPSSLELGKAKKKKRRTATTSENDLPPPIDPSLPPSISPLVSPTAIPSLPSLVPTKSPTSSPRKSATQTLLPAPLSDSPPQPHIPSVLPPPEFSTISMAPTLSASSDSSTPVKRPKSPSRRSETPENSDSLPSRSHGLASSTSKIKTRRPRTPSKRRLSVEEALPPPLDSSSAEMSDEQSIYTLALPPHPSTLSPLRKSMLSPLPSPAFSDSSELALPPPLDSNESNMDATPLKRRIKSKSRDKNDPTTKTKKSAS